MAIFVVAASYLKGRAFATFNHIHHDDVVVMVEKHELRGQNYTGRTIWVVDEVSDDVDHELRVQFAAHAGCCVRRVGSSELVEGLK